MPQEDNMKFTLTLDRRVVAAIQKVLEGRDMNLYLQHLIVAHVINADLIDPTIGKEFDLKVSLLTRVHETARNIFRAQGFSPDFTEKVVRASEADPQWLDDYAAVVGDDPYKTGNPRKHKINRAIGACVREAIGGVVATSPNGKPILEPVSGSIIQKFTRMESCTLTTE